MDRSRRVALVVAPACVVALAAAVLLLVWHEHRVEQRREAEVRRALPVVEAAIHAALEKDAQARITEELQRGAVDDPSAYRQFIVVDRPGALRSFRWGQDFTWHGEHYSWPINPFTGHPMLAGMGPGDFSVRFIWYGCRSGPPDAFGLTGYGADGEPLITLTTSPTPVPVQP